MKTELYYEIKITFAQLKQNKSVYRTIVVNFKNKKGYIYDKTKLF